MGHPTFQQSIFIFPFYQSMRAISSLSFKYLPRVASSLFHLSVTDFLSLYRISCFKLNATFLKFLLHQNPAFWYQILIFFFLLHSKLLRTFAVKTATLTYFAYKSSFGKAPWGQLVSTLSEVTLGGLTRVERSIHTIVHVCGWLVYANCWLCAYLRLLTESLGLLSCGFSKCCLDFLRTWWLRYKNGCFIRQ